MEHDQKLTAPPHDAVFAYYPVEDLRREEEIRLVDVWLVLVRRKAVFFTVAGLIFAAGLAYALLAPPKYRYSALIELGSVSTDSGARAVEAATTALAKINGAFLPAVLADYLKTQPEGTEPPEIRASIPKGSEVLTLTADGLDEEGATLMRLQAAVIERLAQDHASLIEAERRSLRAKITASKSNLETLANERRTLDTQAKRIEELAVTLHAQRVEVARQLDTAIALEQSMQDTTDAPSSGIASRPQMSVEASALREQLMQLDERLAVDLPQSLNNIRMATDGHASEILAQQEHAADLESRLVGIRDTRAIQPPTRSLEPSGLGGAAMMILAAGFGLFLGAVFALLAEGLAGARVHLAEKRVADGSGPGAAKAD